MKKLYSETVVRHISLKDDEVTFTIGLENDIFFTINFADNIILFENCFCYIGSTVNDLIIFSDEMFLTADMNDDFSVALQVEMFYDNGNTFIVVQDFKFL